MSDEQIRASWLKYTMRCARRQPGDTPKLVARAAGDALVREIREAPALAWLPGVKFIEVCTSLRDALGVDGARAFWNQSLHDAIDQTLIRPLAWGGLQLFGRTPAALYRRTPQAWALVTRNMGEMKAEPTKDERSLVLAVEGLPPRCRELTLLHMWEGGFVGQARFVEEKAVVETDARELPMGRARFSIRW